MMQLHVIPLQSVGEVTFGMQREEVRGLFGEYQEFCKQQESQNTADAFAFCHVFYDKQNTCEAIEIFGGTVWIGAQQVFPCALSKLEAIFPDAVCKYGSYIDKAQSVGFYAPDDAVESILFAKPHYYDETI